MAAGCALNATGDPRGETTPGTRPLRRTDIIVHELDGEGLLFDGTSGDTHQLNQTALFVWRACDGSQDARQIAERLVDVYEVSIEDAVRHVERMFREFLERRLIVTAV